MTLDPYQLRGDFPILDRETPSGASLAFLDNAASSQRPVAVLDAMEECYRRYYANVHRGIHALSEESTEAYENARVTVQSFLSATSRREIVFTSGTTASINLVARSWGETHLTDGDTILLTIAEHHANIVPWQQLAARTGCRIEFLPLGENFEIEDDVVREAIERCRPKLFAFTAASNVLGTHSPVKRWTSIAHEHGAVVLIDAAQSVPHRAVNVVDWDADFVVFSGHKLCGPSGIGVLYGKEALLDAMPPFLGGGGMIDRVTTDGFTFTELPEKFEAGTPPIAEAIGLAEAIRYIEQVGLDNIERHEHELVAEADRRLREIEGVEILGPPPVNKAGIVTFTIDRVHAHDVAQWLNTRGVAVRAGHHCAMPLHDSLGKAASSRASFYLYNTREEVDRLVEAVTAVREKFASKGRRRRRQRSNAT
ncbi:MAG: SufS family cysteine desulfurase [Planctomycetota bacterium]